MWRTLPKEEESDAAAGTDRCLRRGPNPPLPFILILVFTFGKEGKRVWKKMKINTDMLIGAFEDHNYEMHRYLDTKSGETVFVTESDMPEGDELKESMEQEPERYVYIEPIDSSVSFRVMEDFVAQLAEGDMKHDLSEALQRRRPFRQFKDTMYRYPETKEEWFWYHDQRMKEIACRWLEDHNIDAELLPLPGERGVKKRKQKKYILSEKQIEYISAAFHLMNDEMRNDIMTLVGNENADENLWIWNELPPAGRADLDIHMLFKLFTAFITLVYKFHSEEEFRLGNRAEELLLHIAIEHAIGLAETAGEEIDWFEDFRGYAFEDEDFLLMYEPRFDGFDESRYGKMMGIGSLSPKEWFEAYEAPRNPHPFFRKQKESNVFPANREIPEYEE